LVTVTCSHQCRICVLFSTIRRGTSTNIYPFRGDTHVVGFVLPYLGGVARKLGVAKPEILTTVIEQNRRHLHHTKMDGHFVVHSLAKEKRGYLKTKFHKKLLT